MVRLQGDFAKPPEKRFNYKHCFDALFRVSGTSSNWRHGADLPFSFSPDGTRRRVFLSRTRSRPKRFPCNLDERQSARIVCLYYSMSEQFFNESDCLRLIGTISSRQSF